MELAPEQLKQFKALSDQFTTECVNHHEVIDGPDGQDWYALSLGWAIAKGLSVTDGHKFAIWKRYTEGYEYPAKNRR
jgi:hypothetical protein